MSESDLADIISPDTLRAALASIGVPTAVLRVLGLGTGGRPRPKLKQVIQAREILLDAGASPERRLRLVRVLGCTYAELTNWVIRADLLRLATAYFDRKTGDALARREPNARKENLIGPVEAAALAAAGVVGVRDLAEWTRLEQPCPDGEGDSQGDPEERRWQELLTKLKQVPSAAGAVRTLRRLGRDKLHEAAAILPARVTTAVPVLLIVKGAGVQKPDDTLNQFLGGFWAAVKRCDPAATLTQRMDVIPSFYRASPHDKDPHNHVTEVRSGEHAIWIREINWEAEVAPPDPFKSLLNEWRLSSYALGRSIADIFRGDFYVQETWRRFLRRNQPRPGGRSLLERLRDARRLNVQALRQQALDFAHDLPERLKAARAGISQSAGYSTAAYALYYDLQHVLILLPTLAVAAAHVPAHWPLTTHYLRLLLALFAVGSVNAIAPAIITSRRWGRYFLADERFAALPGLPNWMLLMLVTAILVDPLTYLTLVAGLLVLEATLLLARSLAWPYRASVGTDTHGQFEEIQHAGDAEPGSERRWERRHSPLMKFCQYLYRHTVVLTVPLGLLLYFFARLLQWTRLFAGLGEWLEQIVTVTLSGSLGDVVGYATDPAHAHRVQSVVAADIHFFLDRPEVSGVHIFAHSMGTPITYETLFHHLGPQYCRGVQTYVTAGSVLSYFQQVNPVLDPVYIERFPGPFTAIPQFSDRFRWINFWNFADPITEFYGLDEYQWYVEQADGEKPERHPASPRDIKTRAGLENHGEYWSNRAQIHEPLFRRLTGDDEPAMWGLACNRTRRPPGPLRHVADWLNRLNLPFHILYAYLWWLAWLLLFGALAGSLPSAARWVGLQELIQSLLTSLSLSLQAAVVALTGRSALLTAVGERMSSILGRAVQFLGSPEVAALRYTLAYASYLVAFVWAVLQSLWSAARAWFEPEPRLDSSLNE